MEQKAFLAAGVGGTHLETAVVDENARIVWRKTLPSPCGGRLMEEARCAPDRIAFALEHWEAFIPHRNGLLDATAAALVGARAEAAKLGLETACAGVGVAGAVNPLTGDIQGKTGALNHPAWGDFNPARELGHRTGLGVVCLNDAKAMALGALATLPFAAVLFEERDGNLQEIPLPDAMESVEDFVEIDPGTGLGGAYIVDGEVWYGADPSNPDPDVGEIWHLEPDPARPGFRFEEMVSGRAISDRVLERLDRLRDPEAEEIVRRTGPKIQDLLAAGSTGIRDEIVSVLSEAGDHIARGIEFIAGPEQQRLDAPVITNFVIGGGLVSGHNPESTLVRTTLECAIRERFEIRKSWAAHATAARPTVLYTTLGGRALLIGAARAAARDS